MKFSVIVPVYNVEKYLNKCIESVINQAYTNFELILIDDESPDNCPQICDEWAEKDNRIKVIHKKNAGVSAARNDGIKLSTGDYILFADSDDYIGENLLQVCYENLLKDKDLDILGFQYNVVIEGKTYTPNLFPSGEWELKTNIQKFNYYKSIITPNGGWGMWMRCYKSSLINDNNIVFPEGYRYGEDFVFVSKCILKANKTKQIDYVGYYYVQHGSSTCHTLRDVPFKEISYMLCLVYDFALNEGNEDLVKNYYIIYDIILSVLVFHITEYTSLQKVKKDLHLYSLIGLKEHNKKIVAQYFKKRNSKNYMQLCKNSFIKRHYQDALYKYANSKSKLILYFTALKINWIFFWGKVKIKLKLIFKKKKG